MSEQYTSHDMAREMHSLAEEFEKFPAFPVSNYWGRMQAQITYWDKEQFIAAVRALGAGRKVVTNNKAVFKPHDATFELQIDRSQVCRMVKPAQWECDPWIEGSDLVAAEGKAATQVADEDIPF